ncbi:hypothetical protein J5N97_026844 [Dioscorea zingiberensis]|uniref:Uncharacterized protein n=1 Tax=Dioscorea zingiberensis TaxID=325984 RepID=A0A9D5C331_9LILI|nr:hypothetical protein J5N97_026844 [Dioscorea zingiberensis]
MKAVVLSPDEEPDLKPVRLSKAATILSRFIGLDSRSHRGASAYLRLASAAFDELVEVHHEIRAHRRSSELEARKQERKRRGGSEVVSGKDEEVDRKIKKRMRDGETEEKGVKFDDRGKRRRREIEADGHEFFCPVSEILRNNSSSAGVQIMGETLFWISDSANGSILF